MDTDGEDEVFEAEDGFGGLLEAAVGGGAAKGVEAAERHGGGEERRERGEVGGDNGFP